MERLLLPTPDRTETALFPTIARGGGYLFDDSSSGGSGGLDDTDSGDGSGDSSDDGSGDTDSGDGGTVVPKSGKVELIVETDGGGLGIQWLQAAGKRFSKLYENYSFGLGKDGKEKIGVTVKPSGKSVSVSADSAKSTTAIFDIGQAKPIATYAASNWVLDITDIMTEKFDVRATGTVSVADKIDDSAKSTYIYNEKYYAAPSVEYYPGFAYKKNLFAHKGFFFASAQDGSVGEKFHSNILQQDFYFVAKNSKLADVTGRSCGPDGVMGTDDDGLPSSLYEFIALCEKMKGNGVQPIDFSGEYENYYSSMILTALAYNLEGYDNAQANYTFDADELEIVTGFTNDNLFPGYDGAKKPTTKKIKVTEETGYYTSWSVAKYYAEAFMKLCQEKGFFGDSVDGGKNQRESISNFIFTEVTSVYAGEVGMHVDGSFWYNEATIADYWTTLDSQTSTGAALDPVEFGWMSLPISYDTSVTEGNGRGQVLADIWQSILVINANVVNNPALENASKKFLQFLCSDEELSAFTSLTTVQKSLNYELTTEDYDSMNVYGQKLWEMTRGENTKSKVLYFAADNYMFNNYRDSFAVTYTTNNIFAVEGSTFFAYMKQNANKDKTVADIFKLQAKSKNDWQTLYGANGTAGSITDVPETLA